MTIQSWTISDSISVDTDAMSAANATLAQCGYCLEEAKAFLNAVTIAWAGAGLAQGEVAAVAAAEAEMVLIQAVAAVDGALLRVRELLAWRERAVQIYLQAEAKALGHLWACFGAREASCSLPGATPWALPGYLASMGKKKGVGDEGLQARYLVQALTTIPLLNPLGMGYLIFGGDRVSDVARLGALAGKNSLTSEPGVYLSGPKWLTYMVGGEVKWRVPNNACLVESPFNVGGLPPRAAQTPVTMAGAVHTLEDSDPGGGFKILRHQNEGGRSWSVVIPGTKTWGLGGKNVQNMLTNLQEVAGVPSDQHFAVIEAMEMAGIRPGEPVEFIGHSQGGAVAGNLAVDPVLASKYTIAGVLTVGAPLGKVPKLHPNSLAIENLGDVVPSTTGAHNRGGTTVYFDQASLAENAGKNQEGGAHSLSTYEQAAHEMETGNDPYLKQVQDWGAKRQELLHLSETSKTTEFVFQTQRG